LDPARFREAETPKQADPTFFRPHNTSMNSMGIDMTRRNKRPRPLLDSERERLEEFIDAIHYSAR
jgi:hypothetical protein